MRLPRTGADRSPRMRKGPVGALDGSGTTDPNPRDRELVHGQPPLPLLDDQRPGRPGPVRGTSIPTWPVLSVSTVVGRVPLRTFPSGQSAPGPARGPATSAP